MKTLIEENLEMIYEHIKAHYGGDEECPEIDDFVTGIYSYVTSDLDEQWIIADDPDWFKFCAIIMKDEWMNMNWEQCGIDLEKCFIPWKQLFDRYNKECQKDEGK